MPVKGGVKCIKYLLFAFNFIFWLAGTALLGIGLWLRFDNQSKALYDSDVGSTSFYTGVYILIGAGALMMLVGFLGCCGAIQESECMLGLFFAFLLLIFALEIAAGIWGFTNKDKIVDELKKVYADTYQKYQDTKAESVKETLKSIHFALNCCGPTGTIIDSLSDTCPTAKDVATFVSPQSCPAAIESVFNQKLHIIGAVGLGIAAIMIFGMIFSMVLCCAIRNNREMV